MNTNVSDFMNALSQCCDRENYLSDVTYALCESNLEFRKFFLKFFFGDKLNAEQVSITREYRFGGCRPDFLIETREPRDFFVVEVKINDRQHHFKDYEEQVLKKLYSDVSKANNCKIGDLKEHVGYIANSRITPQEVKEAKGFKHIRTWQKFYEALKGGGGLKNEPWLGDKVVEGYGKLCKAVCGFVDVSEYLLNVDDFTVIQQSRMWIERLFDKENCPNDVCRYNGYYQQACTKYWKIGRFFEIKRYKKGESVFGWIGIYLVEDDAQCVVEFEDRAGWGGLVCREFKRNCQDLGKTKGRTIEYSVEDQCLYFYMNGTEHGFKEPNLRRFFNNVIQYVRGDEKAFVQEKQNLVKCNQWLAMSRLPTLIKSELFRGWSDRHNGYDVALVEGGMGTYDYARNISSLCVEWFKMLFKHEDKGSREFWGFVGVIWDKCPWIHGEKVLRRLKGRPKFVVCVTSGLGKKGKEQAQRHGWIEQPSDGSWVKIFNDADLKLGIENLRKKFQSTLKAILPIRQN